MWPLYAGKKFIQTMQYQYLLSMKKGNVYINSQIFCNKN